MAPEPIQILFQPERVANCVVCTHLLRAERRMHSTDARRAMIELHTQPGEDFVQCAHLTISQMMETRNMKLNISFLGLIPTLDRLRMEDG